MRRDLIDRGRPPPPPDLVQEALWRELRRSLNARSRVVMTPAGRFGSIAMAAEAFGIAPETVRRLALYRRDGWRFVATPRRPDVPPVPKPKRRPRGAHLKDRRRHPRARPVLTPSGRFASAALAAEAHGLTRQAASHRARNGVNGWRYARG